MENSNRNEAQTFGRCISPALVRSGPVFDSQFRASKLAANDWNSGSTLAAHGESKEHFLSAITRL